MLPPTLSVALPQKTVESYTDKPGKGRAFGVPRRLVRDLDSFGDGTPHYDPEVAYLMAVTSAWAYADERALGAKLHYYGLEGARIRRVSVQNNALLVVSTAYLIQSASGKSAVLAFRGTDPADVITLLSETQVMQREFCAGRVHAGFYAAVEAVWDEVHEALSAARQALPLDGDNKKKQALMPLQSLYITGHSLGGAMALLAAARLHCDDYRDWSPERLVRGVYTFGQPMVGDAAFIQACDGFRERLHRHVYRHDVIPHLPPRSPFGYAHANGERRASTLDRGWELQPESARRVSLLRAVSEVVVNAIEVRTTTRDRIPGLSLDEHMPANYVEVSRSALESKLESVAPRRPLLPRLAAEAASGARVRLEGAVKNVEGTVKRWLGNGHASP
ncbi:MAG TPA: lipase family protein [Polyangiales bacterium]